MPLAIALTGAHVHDSKVFEDLIDSIAPVKGKRGRPRSRPEKLHADKAYDYSRCRGFLRKRGIKARIARRGVESGERLGVQAEPSGVVGIDPTVFPYQPRCRGPRLLPSTGSPAAIHAFLPSPYSRTFA